MWRAVAITCCAVGDMAIGYVACGAITYCDVGEMAMEYVETTSGTETWHIDTWHINKWKSIGGTYHRLVALPDKSVLYTSCSSLLPILSSQYFYSLTPFPLPACEYRIYSVSREYDKRVES
jgi:hypothetical protein